MTRPPWTPWTSVPALALAALVAGCASHRVTLSPDVSERVAGASEADSSGAPDPPKAQAGDVQPVPPLDRYLALLREMSRKARPATIKTSAVTVEGSNPPLALALTALSVFPSSRRHVDVADAYRRVGVMDMAHEHLTLAVRADPGNATAYDGLARIWRDWGFPNMALPEAHRAVYYARASPEAHNTLGTVLQALGAMPAARGQYERALALNPRAAYALNNLCTLDLIAGDPLTAARRCEQAVTLDPALAVASRNLERARAILRAIAVEAPDGNR